MLDTTFAIWALFVLSGAALPLTLHLTGTDESAGARVLVWPVYLVVVLSAATHARAFARAAARHKLVILMAGYLAVTWLWSAAPDVSLRRVVSVVMTTLLGLHLATRFAAGERLRILALTLAFAAVLSALCAISIPEVGISGAPHEGAWRGAFIHKNMLGRTMVLSMATLLALAGDLRLTRPIAYVVAGLSGVLVLLSRSVSAMFIGLAMLLLVPLARAARFRRTRLSAAAIAALVGVASVAAGLIVDLETVLATVGKEATLSGRTELWAAALVEIGERPWLGAGLGAFWLGTDGPSADILDAVGWETPNAHNGALDIALDLGLLGLALFVAGVTITLLRAVRTASAGGTSASVWPFAFLTLLLMSEMTESAVLQQNSFLWTLYVATACAAAWDDGPGRATAAASTAGPDAMAPAGGEPLFPPTVRLRSPRARRRLRHRRR